MKIPLCLLFVLVSALPLYAQWSGDPMQNNAISTTSYEQIHPQIVSDGHGGAIILWINNKMGTIGGTIFAQRINANGGVQWDSNGVAVCQASSYQYSPVMTSDGDGGAIIAWQDGRSGEGNIYAQRISSKGQLQWNPAGVVLTPASVSGCQVNPEIIGDGGGGIIVWNDCTNGDDDVYAQKISSDGSLMWTQSGVAVCTASQKQVYPKLISDGNGGAIVTWQDGRNGDYNVIYAQRISHGGTVAWDSSGVVVCNASGDQKHPAIASDGNNGAIVTWEDDRIINNAAHTKIYAQRINSGGSVAWDPGGVAISKVAGDQFKPKIANDGSSGAYITWTTADTAGSNPNFEYIKAQKISSGGTVLSKDIVVGIEPSTSYIDFDNIINDGIGGAIIVWTSSRYSGMDYRIYKQIFAQRIDASGTIQWIKNGIPVCTAPGDKASPVLVSDGNNGAIVTWSDLRNGNYYRSNLNYDIYTSKIDSNGILAGEPRFYHRAGLNKAIQYDQAVWDTINVPSDGSPAFARYSSSSSGSVVVRINSITHPDIQDLEIYLTHGSVKDTLVYAPASGGADFINTDLSDSASQNLNTGSAPYTGSYKPYESLSIFDGTRLSGDWILKVYDDKSGNEGTLDGWSLGITTTTGTSVEPGHLQLPATFSLAQNYPNPFNPTTTIRFTLPKAAYTTLRIYNVLGQLITTQVDDQLQAGHYSINVDASRWSSGLYFYTLQSGDYTQVKKMLLLK